MLLNIPVLFKVTGVPKNHRNVSDTVVKLYETFEISELSGFEAPVAISGLRINDQKNGNHTRWYENSNWIEEKNFRDFDVEDFSEKMKKDIGIHHCGKLSEALIEGHLVRNIYEDLHLDFTRRNKKLNYGVPSSVELFDEKKFRSIHSTDHAERVDYYSQVFSELIIVDGNLYSKCRPPLLQINNDHWTINIGAFAENFETFDYINNLEYLSFNNPEIHNREDILNKINNNLVLPDILIPEAADFPDNEYMALLQAKLLTGIHVNSYLSYMTKQQSSLWYDLRENFDEALEDIKLKKNNEATEDVIDELVQSLDYFIRNTHNEPLYKENVLLSSAVNEFSDVTYKLIDRWKNRNINLDFDIENLGM